MQSLASDCRQNRRARSGDSARARQARAWQRASGGVGYCDGLVITRYGYLRALSGDRGLSKAAHPCPMRRQAAPRYAELLKGLGRATLLLALNLRAGRRHC